MELYGCFVPSLVEIGKGVLRRRFLNFFNVFSLFHNYFIYYHHLEKGVALHLNPFPQGCFVPSLVEIGQVVLKKKMKFFFLKVYSQTDDGQQAIRKAHLSFQLR